MGTYKGKYPSSHTDGVPMWARPGMLVRKMGGWTAMKVLDVRSSPYHISALICYGPDDERAACAEWRDITDLVPFRPGDSTARNTLQSYWAMEKSVGGYYMAVGTKGSEPGINDHYNPLEGEDDMATKAKKNDLFKFMGPDGKTPMFGNFLTEDCDGDWVMAPVGAAKDLVIVKPEDAEKVMPYTVELKLVHDARPNIHVKAKKGEIEKGDFIVLANGDFARCVRVDSKYDSPNIEPLRGEILLTKTVGEPTDEK